MSDASQSDEFDELFAQFESAWWEQADPRIDDFAQRGRDAAQRTKIRLKLIDLRDNLQSELDSIRGTFREALVRMPSPGTDDSKVKHVLDRLLALLSSRAPDERSRRRRVLFELLQMSFWSLFNNKCNPRPERFQEVFTSEADRTVLTNAFNHFTRASSWRFVPKPGGKRFRGGQAEILEGCDDELGRPAAIKRLRPDLQGSARAARRLEREARITASLIHPGIPTVFGFGRDSDNRVYFAMEWLTGQTLDEAITAFHRNGPAECRRRNPKFLKLLRRFHDACAIVGFAHEKGVLHRDLKPSNIFLGEHVATYVIDWGLAKTGDDESDTTTGEIEALGGDRTAQFERLGTPEFMSPEQAEKPTSTLTPAADVFSLGATLHKLLTGSRPVDGMADNEILHIVQTLQLQGQATREPAPGVDDSGDPLQVRIEKMVQQRMGEGAKDREKFCGVVNAVRLRVAYLLQPRPPRQINSRIDFELAKICQRALDRDPAARFENATQLAKTLGAWLRDERQPDATAAGWRHRLRTAVPRWFRRHLPATVTTVFVCLAAAAGYFAYREYKRADLHRQQKEQIEQLHELSFQSLVDVLDLCERKLPRDVPEQFRKELLKQVAQAYQQYLDKTADQPEYLLRRIDVRRRVANVYRSMGNLELADKQLALAITELRPRAGQANDAARLLAEVFHTRGDVLGDLRHYNEANAAYESSLEQWRDLERRLPDAEADEARRGRGRVYGFRGDMYWDYFRDKHNDAHLKQAQSDYEDSDHIRNDLLDRAERLQKAGGDPEEKHLLDAKTQHAHSQNNLARVSWVAWYVKGCPRADANGEAVARAVNYYATGVRLQRDLVGRAARDGNAERINETRTNLGHTLVELGWLQLYRENWADAEQLLVEAADIFDNLLKQNDSLQIDSRSYRTRAALGAVLARSHLASWEGKNLWQGLGDFKDVEATFDLFKRREVDRNAYQWAREDSKYFNEHFGKPAAPK